MIDKRSKNNISTYESKKAAVLSRMGSRRRPFFLFFMLKSGVLSPYAFMMDVLGSERYAAIVA